MLRPASFIQADSNVPSLNPPLHAIPEPLTYVGPIFAAGCLLLIIWVVVQFASMLSDTRRELGLRCSLLVLFQAARARGSLPIRAFIAMALSLLAAAASCWPVQSHLHILFEPGPKSFERLAPLIGWIILCAILHAASHVAHLCVEHGRHRARRMGRTSESREGLAREIESRNGAHLARREARALLGQCQVAPVRSRRAARRL